MSRLDAAAVERAVAGRALALPRGPHRGKVGEVRAASVGSAMELHDFRLYHPGDDVRHLDWNAVARTGELVLRVRQDEVSPRVEVVLDASRSMEVSKEKAARAREVALALCLAADRGGLEAVLVVVGEPSFRAVGREAQALVGKVEFQARESFPVALQRAPPLRPCGLRLVVTDLLFEAAADAVAQRLARGASGFAVVQVLDAEDLSPTGGAGARLTDAESGEALERLLTEGVLRKYRERLEAHQRVWANAVLRVQGTLATCSAERTIEALAARELAPLFAGGAA